MYATLPLHGTEPILLDLSEDAYRDALALPPTERSRVATVGLSAAFASAHATIASEADAIPDVPANEVDLIAVGEGIDAARVPETLPPGRLSSPVSGSGSVGRSTIARARLHHPGGERHRGRADVPDTDRW